MTVEVTAPATPAPRSRGRLCPGEFADRVRGSRPALWCIAVAVIGDRAEAEDAVQEACLIGLRKLDRFDPETSFTAWMGQIVRNVARNHARRRRRWSAIRLDEAWGGREIATGESPRDLSCAVDGFETELVRALEELPEAARVCLLLRTVREMSYREIGVALGIPEGTAMSHVHRSKARLRERLGAACEVREGGGR